MHFRFSVYSLYSVLFWLLLSGLVVGWLFNAIWPVLFWVCLGVILWHYHHLVQLVNWLWQSKTISPPHSNGVWGVIFDGLYRQIRKYRVKQKLLSERIRQFRDGAEALPDAAIVLGLDLTIIWANKKAHHLIGIRNPGDVGQRIDNLVRSPDFSTYLANANFNEPCSIPSPVDPSLQLEIRLMDYGSEQLMLLARDISQIYRLNNMRRDFVANVSHELKTPLTVVRGYVEMIQTSEADFAPHWQKAFAAIDSQVSRMDRLVEQLLVLSKVEVNQDVEHLSAVKMPHIIRTLVEDSKWLNQEKQHQIIVNIDDSLDVSGVETELKSACANLISNAIAYTPPHGIITINWQCQHGTAVFSVVDNGLGIKASHLNRLTERFYRVDQSRSRDTGGSGLGLAIVKHTLQHHHAKLTIDSQWGKGSTFAIHFAANSLVSAA